MTETGFDTRVLEGAESIDFFLKVQPDDLPTNCLSSSHLFALIWCDLAQWSGFLLQICAFAVDGRYFFSVFSKQRTSCDSPFVQLGLSVAAKYMTPALVRRLADSRLYVGAECLSPRDDTHGYIARQEALVVTCVGQGTFADLASGAQTSFPGCFVEYLPHQAIAAFCAEHGLACDDAVSIAGTPAVLSAFAAAVFEGRDALTHGALRQRLAAFRAAHPESARVRAGAARHGDVVGDTLEGVVLSIRRADGSTVTEKVKLPLYTWRTMMLREWLAALARARRPPGARPPSASCEAGAGGAVGLGELRFVTADAAARMAAFCERWCTSPEGRGHLTRLMKAAAAVLDGARVGGGRVALGGAEHAAVTPSLHVLVADHVEALPAEELDRAAAEFDRILAASPVGEAVSAPAEAAGGEEALVGSSSRGPPPLGAHGRGARAAARRVRVPRGGSCAPRGRGAPATPPDVAVAPQAGVEPI